MKDKDIILSKAEEFVARIEATNKLKDEYEKLPNLEPDVWHQVGVVGVDAGMVWVGDPCYILALPHSTPQPNEEILDRFQNLYEPKELPESLGKSWNEFCSKLSEDRYIGLDGEFYKDYISKGHKRVAMSKQFNYDAGHPGLGVAVTSGWGDGTYPVFVKYNKHGDIKEMKVTFIDESEEENE